MMQKTVAMARKKKIALVAHDNKKEELIEWAKCNCELLAEHSLHSTASTGRLLRHRLGLNVTLLESGPLGGDQQIGCRVTEGHIDLVIFFSDPLEAHPHDADVKALLRIIVVWNIPVACNRASADFIISSPLMSTGYKRFVPTYSKYGARFAVGMRSKPAKESSTDIAFTQQLRKNLRPAAVARLARSAGEPNSLDEEEVSHVSRSRNTRRGEFAGCARTKGQAA
jgi:methylglyoxal synthase